MVRNMKENGSKINNMEMGERFGLITQSMKVNTKWVKNKERDCFSGKKDASTKDTLVTIILKDLALIFGVMGKIISKFLQYIIQ